MSMESIPKTFWHSASVSLLVLTLGFTYIAYQAENFSLKFNRLELAKTSTDALEASLESQAALLQQREDELAELQDLHDKQAAELELARAELEELSRELAANTTGPKEKIEAAIKRIDEVAREPEVSSEIATRRSNLDRLRQQQQTQQSQYQQLQQVQQQLQIDR